MEYANKQLDQKVKYADHTKIIIKLLK